MDKIEHEMNKKMVIQTLDTSEVTLDQVVELLLLMVDDWEVRAAVMRRKVRNTTPATTQVITQIDKKTA